MAHEDLVSVLMPAFKPEHFEAALRSVVGQTHAHLEVLVGDNSGHADIQRIIDAVGDPRVTRIPNHAVSNKSPRLNHMILWLRAKGRYARFVYDDDLVYERSTEVLLQQLKTVPRCVLAWHQRDVIDEHGALRWRHGVLPEDGSAVLDRRLLLDNMSKFLNFVGEPSFTMFDREAIAHFDFNRYARFDMAFLWDIAMYLGIAENGLAAGVGEFLGGFRLHGGQVSSAANVFGAVEWSWCSVRSCATATSTTSSSTPCCPRSSGCTRPARASCRCWKDSRPGWRWMPTPAACEKRCRSSATPTAACWPHATERATP
jgi:hypothetical protein